MKTLMVSTFALALMAATAANADIGGGAHIGGLGAEVHLGLGDDHAHHYRHRHCSSWRWHHNHHDHYCRRWDW